MKNSLRLLIAATVIGGTIAGTAVFAMQGQPQLQPETRVFAGDVAPTCSYINYCGFDTQDAQLASGVAKYTYPTTAVKADNVHGRYTVKSVENKVYWQAGKPLKFGNSSAGGTITYTMNEDWNSAVVWAAGWRSASPQLTINQVSMDIADGDANGNSSNATYTRYVFNNLVNSEDHSFSITSDGRVVITAIAFYK